MDSLDDALGDLQLGHDGDRSFQYRLAVNLGFYKHAEAYYLSNNAAKSDDPSLALDYAKLLFRQCRWGKCSALLDGFLQRNSSHEYDGSGEEWSNKIQLLRSASSVYSRGALRPALEEARRIRMRLRKYGTRALLRSNVCSLYSGPAHADIADI